jgi:hypothetical protein
MGLDVNTLALTGYSVLPGRFHASTVWVSGGLALVQPAGSRMSAQVASPLSRSNTPAVTRWKSSSCGTVWSFTGLDLAGLC